MQSLVRTHSCKNITAALAYALKVEAAKRASCKSATVHELRGEHSKIRGFPCNKEGHYQFQCPDVLRGTSNRGEEVEKLNLCAANGQATHRGKRMAQEVRIFLAWMRQFQRLHQHE